MRVITRSLGTCYYYCYYYYYSALPCIPAVGYTTPRRNGLYREIAFYRLIIIQSFRHSPNRLMGRGSPSFSTVKFMNALRLDVY